jgi:hypothetical protein
MRGLPARPAARAALLTAFAIGWAALLAPQLGCRHEESWVGSTAAFAQAQPAQQENAPAVPAAPSSARSGPGDGLLVGFTAFPYDFTAEAVERVHDVILPNSNLYAIHLDVRCVPWKEALADAALPAWMENDWADVVRRIPSSHAVYVALTPTHVDRMSLSDQCGKSEGKPAKMPKELRGARFDDPRIKRAYYNYVRRAVRTFKPRYINIGIEIGEMVVRRPGTWPAYEALFDEVFVKLKREFPDLQVGTEFVLQWLLHPKVAQTVKPLVERSDYIGISFYPYGTEWPARFGAPALPEGADQWRKPLEWLRKYTDKPIGICETGYTSKYIYLSSVDMNLRGDEATQAAFMRDLADIAQRDRYAFVVWFLAVDPEPMVKKLGEADEFKVWLYCGFFDAKLRAKPAWQEWQKLARAAGVVGAAARPEPLTSRRVGFEHEDELFLSSPDGRVSLDPRGPRAGVKAMRWDIDYGDDWAICWKELQGLARGAKIVKFWVRSDRGDAILFRVEERGGETFYAFVPAGTDWSSVSLELGALEVDPSKRKDGRLDPERIEKIVIGDGSAASGARGTRSIWLASFVVEGR